MPRRCRPAPLGADGKPRFNEAAASNAAEILAADTADEILTGSFNEAAASNAAEIPLHITTQATRKTASMRPRQVMPRRWWKPCKTGRKRAELQ